MHRLKRYPDTHGLLGRHLLLVAAAVGAVSFVSVYFHSTGLSGLAMLFAVLGVTTMFLRKAWVDNRHTVFVLPNWRKALLATLVLFVPVAFLLSVTFFAGLWVDDRIEQGIQWAENKTMATVVSTTEWVEEVVEERRPWWNLKGLVQRIVVRKVVKPVQKTVIVEAPARIRLGFSFVYSVLRVTQYFSYASIAYLAVRSFVFLFMRAVLYAGATVKFRLPHSMGMAPEQPLFSL